VSQDIETSEDQCKNFEF